MGLCRSNGSRATSHQSWRFEKNSAKRPGADEAGSNRADWQNLFLLSTLSAYSSAVLWSKKTHSTSLERSKPPLLTQTLSKSLTALLVYFISVQSTLISIGFISKGAVFVGPICRYVSNYHTRNRTKEGPILCETVFFREPLYPKQERTIYLKVSTYYLLLLTFQTK